MAMIYFLDGNQEVIKIARSEAVISAIQTQELPEDNSLLRDYLSVRLRNDGRLFNAQYMAIKSYAGATNAFDLYRVSGEVVPDEATSFEGVQVAPYELDGIVVEDIRPNDQFMSVVIQQILADSDWSLGYTASNLPRVTTNFYYISAKDALKKLQEMYGVEIIFKVEITGNRVTSKWVEVYRQLGNRTLKRFSYGTNALQVVRETSYSDIYTALIGRGKGEEVGETEEGDATYGRKIDFADVEWSVANGDPVNKPKGQKYIELPSATAEYGVKLINGNKAPRIGLVEFSDTEDPGELIQKTYQQLLIQARPKVLFKSSVINIGNVLIGDTVTIHRYDLGFHYQARVRKVIRDRKNNNKTQVEIGDVVHTPSTKRQMGTEGRIDDLTGGLADLQEDVTYAQKSADGKNTIFYGSVEPTNPRVGDTWFRPHPSLTGESQILVWDGEVWELILDTSDTTKNAREIEAVIEQAEADKRQAKLDADQALADAKAHADAEDARIKQELESEVGGAIELAEQAKADAVTKANQAYEDAVTEADRLAAIRDNGITIEAGQITAGVIDAARLDAVLIVTEGLTTNVIKSTHIDTSTATIDKLFANDAMVNRLTAKTAFINSVKAVDIDAARITSGTINAARLNATSIVTNGLSTNVIKSTHIESSNLLVDKIFSTSAYIDRLTSKAAFISNIKAIEISADKITAGTLNAADVRIINLDVGNISGFDSTFIQTRWNGINSSVQVNSNGLEMMGSASWRRNIMNATGIELYNGSGGYNLAGTIGYFKGRLADATYGESVINVGTARHYIGITANSTHDVAIGYNSSSYSNRNYDSAIRVRGSDGNIYFDKQIFMPGVNTHLHMDGNHIRQVSQIRMRGPNSDSIAGIYNDGSSDSIWVQGWGGVRIGDRRSSTGGYMNHLEVTQSVINAHVPLNMNGNEITNQSDIRLKRNIEDSSLDALREIDRLKFVEFDWDMEKPTNEGMSNERQFGIIAQYSPFLQTKVGESESYLSVDLTKQINLNSKATQELLHYTRLLEKRIEVLEGGK